MKRTAIWGGLALCALFILSCRPASARDDWQYWSEYNLNYKLSDQWSLIVNPSVRLYDDMSEDQYWETRVGVSYKLTDQWAFNAQVNHGETKNAADKWIDENTVELQPTYKWQWSGFDFSNRFRLEYRIVNGAEKWRYRDFIKVGKKTKIFGEEFTPFIAHEFFYDEAVDQLNQNRSRVGISKKLNKQLTMTVYYQYKSLLGVSTWAGDNIIGTGIDIAL